MITLIVATGEYIHGNLVGILQRKSEREKRIIKTDTEKIIH